MNIRFMTYLDNILLMDRTLPAGTQYFGNIRLVFPQRYNVPGIQETFGEYLKEKYF